MPRFGPVALALLLPVAAQAADYKAPVAEIMAAATTNWQDMGTDTDTPPPYTDYFSDDFLLYWALMGMALVRSGRRTFGPSFDREKLDNLTLGLDEFASRNLHRLPLAIARLSMMRRRTARFYLTYDAVLTPTVADETPRVGHLDPTADYEKTVAAVEDVIAGYAGVDGDVQTFLRSRFGEALSRIDEPVRVRCDAPREVLTCLRKHPLRNRKPAGARC